MSDTEQKVSNYQVVKDFFATLSPKFEPWVWVRFHGIHDIYWDLCLDAEAIAEAGCPVSYLREQLENVPGYDDDESLTEYVDTISQLVYDHDHEITDAEGNVNEFCDFKYWGSCDWTEYAKYLELSCDTDREIFLAAQELGIDFDEAMNSFIATGVESVEKYIEDEVRERIAMGEMDKDTLEDYFNFEAYARDNTCGYSLAANGVLFCD